MDRRQFITIKVERSEDEAKYGDVPQGSVLRTNLYRDYTASLSDIFSKHGVLFHTYANATQLCLHFSPREESMTITELEQCDGEVREWMATNWLHLNESKTDFIIFG